MSSRDPIRVGFVLHSMHVAGAEKLVAELIARLRGRIAPTIFCLDAVGTLGESLMADGVPVVGLGRRPGRDLRAAWRLARELRARRIEVVHAHQYTPFFYAALARWFGAPSRIVFTEHGRHHPDLVSPSRRLANRIALGRCANIITAVSAFSARGLASNDGFPSQRIRIVANGIDLARYAGGDRVRLRHRLGLDINRRYIINIARFHPVKDQQGLLRAFLEVSDAVPDVDLLLAGDGALRAACEELACHLGISSRVRFLGVRTDVADLLQASDLFVLSSITEAASLTLLEALASALPVVVTNVGGNPEIVRHGVEGVLAAPADPHALAAAIVRVLGDTGRAEAMGQAGRRRAASEYRLDETVNGYYATFLELARRNAA
jgi:glycosyltransferase involved in cell wall biosynthesis